MVCSSLFVESNRSHTQTYICSSVSVHEHTRSCWMRACMCSKVCEHALSQKLVLCVCVVCVCVDQVSEPSCLKLHCLISSPAPVENSSL